MILWNSHTELGQPWRSRIATGSSPSGRSGAKCTSMPFRRMVYCSKAFNFASCVPVVPVLPVGGELFGVREARPVAPPGARDLVRPARAVQALPQIGEKGLGQGDPEGFNSSVGYRRVVRSLGQGIAPPWRSSAAARRTHER